MGLPCERVFHDVVVHLGSHVVRFVSRGNEKTL